MKACKSGARAASGNEATAGNIYITAVSTTQMDAANLA
jgi:hypothetical protein